MSGSGAARDLSAESGLNPLLLRRFHLFTLVTRLRQIGVDVDVVLGGLGVSMAELGDPESPVPSGLAGRLWQKAVEASGDPDFGLHLAEQVRPGFFDVLDYLARSSATLGEALSRAGRYARLLHAALGVQLEIRDERAWLHLALPSWAPPGVAGTVLACVVVMARQMTGVDIAPLEIHLMSPRPADTSEHQRIFRGTLFFSAASNALVTSAQVLSTPLVTADPKLCGLLDSYAAALLESISRSSVSFSDRVREEIVKGLRSRADTSLEHVALRLHVSSRTLRRRLQSEGTTHQQLLDEVRRSLALRYMQDPEVSAKDVAYELGFSDPSSLRRLVKRVEGALDGS